MNASPMARWLAAGPSISVTPTLIVLSGACGLVLLVVAYVVARRLTNAALRWLAILGDIPDPLTDVAATVDLFAAAMGYAALTHRRRHPGKRDLYADWLALSYSVAAVLANLAAAVCGGRMSLTVARNLIATDWITAGGSSARFERRSMTGAKQQPKTKRGGGPTAGYQATAYP